MNRFFGACSELSMSFPCSYFSLKEINSVQTCSIQSPIVFPTISRTMEFERYISKLLNTLCHMNLYNAMNISFPSFDMIDLNKMKRDNMNHMCGLKKMLVLPSYNLFPSSQKFKNIFFHRKGKDEKY